MDLAWGAIGLVVGLCGAAIGVAAEKSRRRRVGEPTDARSLTGFGEHWFASDSVERRLAIDAAALAFFVAAVALAAYGIAWAALTLPDPPVPVLMGATGAVYGLSCAVIGKRRGWT